MYLPITIIGVVWGVSFVRNVAEVSDMVAASVVSAMFLGAAIGSPCFAYFSDYIKKRRLPMILGSVVTSCVWFTVFLFEIPLQFLYVLFFVGGFAYTAKCLSFASICETMPLKMSGVSIAFVNAIVMSTGIIFLPIIGALIDYHWDKKVIDNIPHYTAGDYQFALIVIPVLLGLSSILVLFMKETHPEYKLPKEYGSVIDIDVL